MALAQFKYGDAFITPAAIATALPVAVGDIVGMSAGTLIVADATSLWDTNIATTQTAFSLLFLGVSNDRKDANVARAWGQSNDNQVSIVTAGVVEFDCASATFEVGDWVGPAKASGNNMEAQKVVAVASDLLSIGRVAERGTSITRVKVRIHSKLAPAARQA